MSDVQTYEFLKLFKTLLDTTSDVLREYFDSRIIKLKYGGSFPKFLDENKHIFFHKWKQNVTCCHCAPGSDKAAKGFDNSTFLQFYTIDDSIKCTVPKATRAVKAWCICRILSVQNKSLQCYDQSALTCVLLQYDQLDSWLKKDIVTLREVRNELCHSPKTTSYSLNEIQDKWMKMQDATLNLAKDIGFMLHKYVEAGLNKERQKVFKKNQSEYTETKIEDMPQERSGKLKKGIKDEATNEDRTGVCSTNQREKKEYNNMLDKQFIVQIQKLTFEVNAEYPEEVFMQERVDSHLLNAERNVVYVEWKLDCPIMARSKVDNKMKEQIGRLNDWFVLDNVFIGISRKLILQSHIQHDHLRSKPEFEHYVRTFIEKLWDSCHLQRVFQSTSKISVDIKMTTQMDLWEIKEAEEWDEYQAEEEILCDTSSSKDKNNETNDDDLKNLGISSLLDYKLEKTKREMKQHGRKATLNTVSYFIGKRYFKAKLSNLKERKKAYPKRHQVYNAYLNQKNKTRFLGECTDIDMLYEETNRSQCSSNGRTCDGLFDFTCHRCLNNHIADCFYPDMTIRQAGKMEVKVASGYSVLDMKLLPNDIFAILVSSDYPSTPRLALLVVTEKEENNSDFDVRPIYKAQIAVINPSKLAFTAHKSVYIVALSGNISNIFQSIEPTGGITFGDETLFVATAEKIIMMSEEGDQTGAIDIKNVQRLFHFFESKVYCTNKLQQLGERVAISSINLESRKAKQLPYFPVTPECLSVNRKGDIVLMFKNCIWLTSNKGRSFQLIIPAPSIKGMTIEMQSFSIHPSTSEIHVALRKTKIATQPGESTIEVCRYSTGWLYNTQSMSTSENRRGNEHYLVNSAQHNLSLSDTNDHVMSFDEESNSDSMPDDSTSTSEDMD